MTIPNIDTYNKVYLEYATKDVQVAGFGLYTVNLNTEKNALLGYTLFSNSGTKVGIIRYQPKDYMRANAPITYNDELGSIRWWLFGDKNTSSNNSTTNNSQNIIYEIYRDGSVKRIIPISLKDEYFEQFNDGIDKGFFTKFVYINGTNRIDLGTYNSFFVFNLYNKDSRYGDETYSELIDIRTVMECLP